MISMASSVVQYRPLWWKISSCVCASFHLGRPSTSIRKATEPIERRQHPYNLPISATRKSHTNKAYTKKNGLPVPRYQRSQFLSTSSSSFSTASISSASFNNDRTELSPLAVSIRNSILDIVSTKLSNIHNINNNSNKNHHNTSTPVIHIHVVLSVSGGCDSVAMLHACMEWKKKHHQQQQQKEPFQNDNGKQNIRSSSQRCTMVVDSFKLHIHVVHFHHRQRSVDADLDCDFVQKLVQDYNSSNHKHENDSNNNNDVYNDNPMTMMIDSFHVQDWRNENSNNSKKENHCNENDDELNVDSNIRFSQDIARQWRRLTLLEYTKQQIIIQKQSSMQQRQKDDVDPAHEFVFGIILTGHHRDDSNESIMLKLLRGVHLLNVKGIDAMTLLWPPSSSATNHTTIYLIRPLLQHSKQDLIDYLQANHYPWREDISNTSPKYLRNRIRYELLPLLQNMTHGAFVEKRLKHFIRQCREVAMDVTPRVEAYLAAHTLTINTTRINANLVSDKDCQNNISTDEYGAQSLWKIVVGSKETEYDVSSNSNRSDVSRLIRSQALYTWMTQQIDFLQQSQREQRPTTMEHPMFHLSYYETTERVLRQLENFSDRLQWTIELGGGFHVIRQGEVLKIVDTVASTATKQQQPQQQISKQQNAKIPWKWTIIDKISPNGDVLMKKDDAVTTVEIVLPWTMVNSDLHFFSTTLENVQNVAGSNDNPAKPSSSLWFVPPWKKTPVKLRQFLRGQDIPLHQRDQTPLLFATSVTTTSSDSCVPLLIAVQLVHSGRWVVHQQYSCHSCERNNNTRSTQEGYVKIQLVPSSSSST